ncbi:alpha/beta hydrolase [Nonomuraea sp. NPDC049419]|uniref:alpha/beta hydrolase n=1 Tax=Nonomuraea sp. NPDC049419 TaxID=3155772 RepID=UPI00344317D3
MKRLVGVVAGVAVLVAGVGSASGTAGAVAGGTTPAGVRQAQAAVAWAACPKVAGKAAPAALECATVRVPLDYKRPRGQSIKLALNRIKAKVPRGGGHLGTLLINPGGPGSPGRALTEYVATSLPAEVSERYDIVGFDPRGVGGSEPAVHCVDAETYYKAPRLDQIPRNRAHEKALLARAAGYAKRCGDQWSWLLPHLTTENSARDMDRIRAALGEEKISYFGYSYGTYLGAVYATLFPSRIKRLVMDSTVDPGGVWYASNLKQDRSFERRHRQFLAWTARHNDVYKLGSTVKQTSFAFYAMRDRLRSHPAGGVVGPSELDDTFTLAGYTDKVWPSFAQAWSSYVRDGDVTGLTDVYTRHGKNDAADENGYAVYLGVECSDARWPRKWDKWRTDMTRMHRKAPFLTWPNAWYNAPCAFWPVRGGTPVQVHDSPKLPPFLILQSKDDAATPYQGALEMAERFPRAKLVVDQGGNHGVTLSGNACMDRHLVTYLRDGTLPRTGAACAAAADPKPAAHMASGSSRAPDLLGLLGALNLLKGAR